MPLARKRPKPTLAPFLNAHLTPDPTPPEAGRGALLLPLALSGRGAGVRVGKQPQVGVGADPRSARVTEEGNIQGNGIALSASRCSRSTGD